MDAEFQETLTPYLAPIPGDDPCGTDERHSHTYLEIDNEAKKLGGLRQDPVNWELVLELSTRLLTTSTKDLKLAGCMTLALYHRNGFGGLDRGLHVVVELLDNYWEQVHPRPRSESNLRRRASPLSWLNGHLKKLFASTTPKKDDAPALVAIQATAQRYKNVCLARFDGQGPAFEDLMTAIARATNSMDQGTAPGSVDEVQSKAHKSEAQTTSQAAIETRDATVESLNQGDPVQNQSAIKAANAIPVHIEALLEPISTEQPSGNEARYSEPFEQARTEAKRVDDQLSDKKPDWELVLDRSSELLETATKDLNLAAYITLANYEHERLSGLADGLVLVTELMDRFWDSIYPQPRSPTNFKRRSSPLSWLNSHVAKRLMAHQIRAQEGPDIVRLNQVIARYASVCNQRFQQAAPATRQLMDHANRLSVIHAELSTPAPKEAPSPTSLPTSAEPAPSVEAPAEASVTAPSPIPPKLETSELQAPPSELSQVSGYLSEVGKSLSEVARQLRETKPTDALSYRLHRQAVWMHLNHAPPVQADKKTSIPALPDQVRKQLETLLNHENWTHLLDEAESRLDKFRFSLDLHRYVVTALKGMGQSKDAVTNVIAELRSLLTRMPSLLELEFSNGTPLADEKTTAWILSEVLAGSGRASISVDATDDAWFEPISNAVERDEHPEILCAMQSALKDAPDQIQFVQRALKGAAQLRSVPGLSLLLAQLAHQAVKAMSSSGLVVHSGLETECLQLLLQLRSSNAARSAQVAKLPELMPLAVELGQRDLASALAYFAP